MGKLFFSKDGFISDPTIVLSSVGGKFYGEIPFIAQDSIEIVVNMDAPDEISFDVYKYFDGVLNPLWNKIVDFKIIWYKELNRAYIISVDINDKQGLSKHVTGVAAGETELGQILLRNIEINTESDITSEDENGYSSYVSSTIYNETNKKASILDRMLEKAPHYSIDYVDASLADLWRPYSFNEKSIKDCFDEIAEDVGCLFIYNVCIQNNALHRGIRVYDLMNKCRACGERFESDGVCPECGSSNIKTAYGTDTGIVIDRDNLADTITYETDTDSVKNCFYLQAGDEYMTAVIHTCLPSNDGYMWYMSDDTIDDMSDALASKIRAYNAEYKTYTKTKVYDISSSDFSNLVTKYYNETYNNVVYNSTTTGFSGVIDAYFNATTMRYYLQTSMMPTIENSDITAASQCALILSGLRNGVSTMNNTETISDSTVESMIKNMAKMWYSQSTYNLTIHTNSWRSGSWTGTITLTSKADPDNDKYTTDAFSVAFVSDYELYVMQRLDKAVSVAEEKDTGMSALFKKDASGFANELKLYSLDCLNSISDICKTLLDLLTEQGAGDANSLLYEDIYLPYYNKGKLVLVEIANRIDELSRLDSYIKHLEDMINEVHDALDFETYVGSENMLEFAAYRREDTYKNDNYISDGLTDSEVIENARYFVKTAEREIVKSAELQHTITANLFNLMLMKEFEGLLDNFDVGNWVRIIVDDNVYKLRLLSYTFRFGGLTNINVKFSDVSKVSGGLSDIKSILSQASNMATSYGSVSRNADKAKTASDSFSKMFRQGLDLTNTKLLSDADNQEMTIDNHGMLMRKYDPIIDDYVDEQIKMTNTTIAFSDDDWETVKTAFGKYYDGDGNAKYGLIGETIIGKVIAGGALTIESEAEDGSTPSFKVDGDGVQITNANILVSKDDDGGKIAEIALDPTNGFMIGKNGLYNPDGTVNEDNLRLWVDGDGNVKLITQNGNSVEVEIGNQITSTVKDINNDISSLGSDITGMKDSITKIEQTANDVKIAVENIDSIDASNDGKYFTFNKDGLTIAASTNTSSGLATVIDEDGMTINNDGTSMLEVTSDGVDAVNLIARQYLIIGENGGRSRFEDYNIGENKYTACFWIG